MRNLFYLTWLNLKQIFQYPAYSFIIIIALALITINPLLSSHSFVFESGNVLSRPAERMLAELSLATVMLSAFISIILSSTLTVSKELSSGYTSYILTTKITKFQYLLSKNIATFLASSVVVYISSIHTFLISREGILISSARIDVSIIKYQIALTILSIILATVVNTIKGRGGASTCAMSLLFFTTLVMIFFFNGWITTSQEQDWSKLSGSYNSDIITYWHGIDYDVIKCSVSILLFCFLLTPIITTGALLFRRSGVIAFSSLIFIIGTTYQFALNKLLVILPNDLKLSITYILNSIIPDLQVFALYEVLSRELTLSWHYLIMGFIYSASLALTWYLLSYFILSSKDLK